MISNSAPRFPNLACGYCMQKGLKALSVAVRALVPFMNRICPGNLGVM